MAFNPFTGAPRHPDDIASDPAGLLVWDGEEPLRPAAPAPAQAVPLDEDRIRHLWDKACRTVTVQGGGNDVLVFADYLTRELRGIAPKAAQPQEKT